MLALPRVLLAICVVFSLPLAHARSPSNDSPMAMVEMVINGIGLFIAALILVGGSLAQILLRKKPIRYTVFAETAWLLLVGAAIGCVTLIND